MSRGSVVETFIHQLRNGLEVTITNLEMERFFMDIDQASELILHTIQNEITGITILKMGKPVKILDVATQIAKILEIGKFEILEIGKASGEKISEDLFSMRESRNLHDLGSVMNTPFIGYIPLELFETMPPNNDQETITWINSILEHNVVESK
jgi:UDP-glucose 4-epimerase